MDLIFFQNSLGLGRVSELKFLNQLFLVKLGFRDGFGWFVEEFLLYIVR